MVEERLIKILEDYSVPRQIIENTIESGYIIRDFADPISGRTWEAVSDKMYGNKEHSSIFNIDKFVGYVMGTYKFRKLPHINEYKVKNYNEINEILSDTRRQLFIKEGSLSFRGQTCQYMYERKVPSPVRANHLGKEISIFPGAYRQKSDLYSFKVKHEETRSLLDFVGELEPNNSEVYADSEYKYDVMRVEQHYASQTAGLDVSFDIETAIFFATHKFNFNSNNIAYYESIKRGEHQGIIYGFRFYDPKVKSSEFLIKKFDLFKTYKPERILRQNCGLPLIGDFERNIAVCDLDFIIHLHNDFDYESNKNPTYMFPNTQEDKFYGKLLGLKDQHPDLLQNVVEYAASRPSSVF